MDDTRPRCEHGVVYGDEFCIFCLRAEKDRLRELVLAVAEELVPDCPDYDAYIDGDCDLVDTARLVMAHRPC